MTINQYNINKLERNTENVKKIHIEKQLEIFIATQATTANITFVADFLRLNKYLDNI